MTEDEEFCAWLDGELEGERAASVAARVAANPRLEALASRDRAMVAGLRKTFDAAAAEGPGFVAAPSPAANDDRRVPAWAALAASLAVGVVAGSLLTAQTARRAPVAVQDGQLLAAAALDNALDTQLASTGGKPAVRIGLTFRNDKGDWCRSFEGAAGAGLACRESGQWRVQALFPATQAGDYRMAAGPDPRLAAVIDSAMASDAADALSERTARDNGWR